MPRDRPSLTARKVASDFLFMVEDPDAARFAPAGSIRATYDILRASGRLKPWMVSLIQAPWYQALGRRWERRIIPGQMMHLVLRKRFFDDEVRRAIIEGATHVLVVGGGYDTLCLRLAAEYPEVTFLEIDRPPTHREKVRGLEALGAHRANLHCLAADLGARGLVEVLEESGQWDSAAPSVVVAEGVLMYLGVEDVESFLVAIRSATGPGSRLLLTYLHQGDLDEVLKGWLGTTLRYGLRLIGEPFRWGVRDDRDLASFLASRGYRILGDVSRYDLGRRYLEPAGKSDEPLARLERVVAVEPLPIEPAGVLRSVSS